MKTAIEEQPKARGVGALKGNSDAEKHPINNTNGGSRNQIGFACDRQSFLTTLCAQEWRRELVNDLGGADNISTQQHALIDWPLIPSCYSIQSTLGYSPAYTDQ